MSEEVCPICVEDIVDSTLSDCSHTFCRNCIRTWAKSHFQCPVCNSDFFTIKWRNASGSEVGEDDVFLSLYKGSDKSAKQVQDDNIEPLDISVITNELIWMIEVCVRLTKFLGSRHMSTEIEMVDDLKFQAQMLLEDIQKNPDSLDRSIVLSQIESLTALLTSIRSQAINDAAYSDIRIQRLQNPYDALQKVQENAYCAEDAEFISDDEEDESEEEDYVDGRLDRTTLARLYRNGTVSSNYSSGKKRLPSNSGNGTQSKTKNTKN